MAKAKKQEPAAGDQPAARLAPKGKQAAAKKASGGGTAAGGGLGVPLIDTSLAAEAAAKMVLHRAAGGAGAAGTGSGTGAGTAAAQPQADAGSEGQDKRETSTFKQLKQGLSKPASQGLGGILGSVQGGKKANQPFGGPRQQARNQTFGADVNRSGVPRRTGG